METPKNNVAGKIQEHVGNLANNSANLVAFSTVASTAAGAAATMFKDTKLGAIALAAQKLLASADKLIAANQAVGAVTGGKTALHLASETLTKHDEKFHQVANTIEKGLKAASPTSAIDQIRSGLAKTGLVGGAENVTTVQASAEAANNEQFNQKGNSRA